MPFSTRIAIALGSNLERGDLTLAAILDRAVDRLELLPNLSDWHFSSWYRTVPVGPPQPDYLNGCAIATFTDDREDPLDDPPADPSQDATDAPLVLLRQLQTIENENGRERLERWGARTLDLDLIFWGDRCFEIPDLTVPHPRWRDRAFVLVPLAEIAPDWRDPVTGETIATLAARCDASGVHRFDPATD